jgi:hypothetical protein
MNATRMPRTAAAIFVAAVMALVVAIAPGTAGAETAKIKMKGKTEKALKFAGATEVERGQKLKIVNKTSPKKVGPHTFTLLESNLVPKNEKQGEKCFGPGGICQEIFAAHEIDEESETIGKPDIDVAKKGWDFMFDEGVTGDSWFTFEEDEKTSRRVKADSNSKLSYFCVIHPWMVGELKVK